MNQRLTRFDSRWVVFNYASDDCERRGYEHIYIYTYIFICSFITLVQTRKSKTKEKKMYIAIIYVNFRLFCWRIN